jgi:integrase
MRLEWHDVKLEEGHIEVTAKKAKTAQRRIVPISENLVSWLRPFASTTGLIFHGHPPRFLSKVTRVAATCHFAWPQNALRPQLRELRLAVCKSAAEVALEMGNSPRMIFEHYRELVTPADAKKWWQVARPLKQHELHSRVSRARGCGLLISAESLLAAQWTIVAVQRPIATESFVAIR